MTSQLLQAAEFLTTESESPGKKIPVFMELEGSLPCSQNSAILSYPKKVGWDV
jgi:hypothetical protein